MFVDIEDAFDSMWPPAVPCNLKDLDTPQQIWEIIRDYFSERKVVVEGTGENKRSYNTAKGIPLGPPLWDIAIQPCLEELDQRGDVCGGVAFADDVANVTSGNSRNQIEVRAGAILCALDDWCS